MATARNVTVDSEAEEVHIESITVRDRKLVSVLEDASEDPETAIEEVLRVGAATLELAETSREVEYVRREFDALRETLATEVDDVQEELDRTFGEDGELADQLDDALGEDGMFAQRLEDELGEDGSVIRRALDPDVEGTPTYRLEQAFREEFRSLRERLDREEGRAEERSQSPKSGYDFEDELESLLHDAVYNTSSRVERTSDEEGELPGRDVGDLVYTVGETGQRIVVEAKSVDGYTRPQIREEMADAIENRDADYGIFVSECESYVPDAVGYFEEYDDFVCVSLSADEDDDVDPGFLHIALNWARARVVQDYVDTGDELDPEEVRSRVEGVRDALGKVTTAKRKCTSLQDTAEGIKTILDDLRDDVNTELDGITTELSKVDTES